jgi:hypothetical protein
MRSIVILTILLVAATTLTRAQNTLVTTSTPENRFTDIADLSFSDLNIRYYSDFGPNYANKVVVGEFRDVFAYNLGKHFAFGIGAGLEFKDSILSLPLSGDFKWYITRKKTVTFLNFYLGSEINLANNGYYGSDGRNQFMGLNFGVLVPMQKT